MKYINADLIKELMKRSIALQGNCEYTLWLQTVDNYVENLPSIDIDSRGHETMSDKVWCSKCRYLYRDFKYGLSCYRLMDDEPCKFEYRKTENSSEIPNNSTRSKMEQVDKDINVRSKWETPPKFEHKGIQTACVTVPACLLEFEDEPQTETQTETQNSNLTFEKQTDCAWK